VQYTRIYMGLHNKRHDRLLAVPVIGILSITLCGRYMTLSAELLSEWSYNSTPCICPYSMHRDTFTFTFIKHKKKTTGCEKDMLFIWLIFSLYVHFCQKTEEIIVVFIVCCLGTCISVLRRKALHNCVVGN